jgi:hypothetical protein
LVVGLVLFFPCASQAEPTLMLMRKSPAARSMLASRKTLIARVSNSRINRLLPSVQGRGVCRTPCSGQATRGVLGVSHKLYPLALTSCPDSLTQPSTVQRSPASAGTGLYFPSLTSCLRGNRESTGYPRKSLMNQIKERKMATERVVRVPMLTSVQFMMASSLFLSRPLAARDSC